MRSAELAVQHLILLVSLTSALDKEVSPPLIIRLLFTSVLIAMLGIFPYEKFVFLELYRNLFVSVKTVILIVTELVRLFILL